MGIFPFYASLTLSAWMIIGVPGSITLIDSILHLKTKAIDKEPNRVKHALIACAYFACAGLGFWLGLASIFPNFAMMLEDLGTYFAWLIVVFLVGGFMAEVLGGIEHALVATSKRSLFSWPPARPRSFNRATTVTSFQALALLAVLIAGSTTFLVTYLAEPSNCFSGNHEFSDPAYDIEQVLAQSHYNTRLDNATITNQTVLESLERGLWAMTTLQSAGGFPMEAKLDGSEFYGDRGSGCPYYPGEFALQGGTPKIASVYVEMYKVEPNPVYLSIATAAAEALLAIQDETNGGFFYDGRRYPDGRGYQPHPMNERRAAIFDDNVMQSCLTFLLDMYDVTGNTTFKDAAIRGIDYIFELEKTGGGWPQRSNFLPNEYPSYITLNDDCMQDIVNVLLKAHSLLGNASYLEAAERAGQFLIRVQGNGGSTLQQGWAQQYNDDQPAWARKFEPPTMCAADTQQAIEILMDLYLATENETYLDPIPAAISWLNNTNTTILIDTIDPDSEDYTPGTYVWSRLYELHTNRMIVGNRNGGPNGNPPFFYEYNKTRDTGYSWFGNYGINGTINDYYTLVNDFNKNVTEFIAWRDAPSSLSSLLGSAQGAVERQHAASHLWLDGGNIDDSAFSSNAMRIVRYLAAV